MRASRGAVSWGHSPGACPDPMLIEHLAVAVAIAQCRDFSLGSALQGRLTSCMMSGGIVQARKDAASRLECLHVQAAVMRSAGPESFLMLHTKCSRCPKPNTSRRRAGCIIAAANGQSSRESPRRRWPVVGRISAQVKLRRVDTGADRREVERGSTRENGKPSG